MIPKQPYSTFDARKSSGGWRCGRGFYFGEAHQGADQEALRLKKSMGLVELGRHTGLSSASFLSQLETGQVVPTLRNLARIAHGLLEGSGGYFFEPEPTTLFRVHRRKDRSAAAADEGGDDPAAAASGSLGILCRTGNWILVLLSSCQCERDGFRGRTSMRDASFFTC